MATTETKKFDAKWLIPILLFAGAAWSAYRAIRAMNSNSTTQTPGGIVDNTGNVGWFETAGGWFCLILLVVGIVVTIAMKKEK